jgi:FixJ family two-component response regulator
VHIVDDDPSFRAALERRLKQAGYQVATYSSGQQLLERLPDNDDPGCILLDVRIPGLSGPELQSRLSKLGSILPVVFLTAYPDTGATVRVIKAGAEDFLIKPVRPEELLEAVARAIVRHAAMQGKQRQKQEASALVATLTPREREVFELVVQGKMHKQIAIELGIAERTVKAHRHRVMEKTKAQSLPGLVLIAERVGLLGPEGPPYDKEQAGSIRDAPGDNIKDP